jgi:hypothetical protein
MLSPLGLAALLVPVDDGLIRDAILVIQHLHHNADKLSIESFVTKGGEAVP